MKMSTPAQLNILYVIDELITKGGTEKHLFELAEGMASRGHCVTVVSLNEGEYAKAFKCLKGVEYRCLMVNKIHNYNGLIAILKLSRFISTYKIDIVQTFHTGADLIGPLAAKLSLKQPVVLSSRRDTGYTKAPRHINAQRIINRLVDAILANSLAVQSAVVEQEAFPLAKIKIIYNGIEVDRYNQSDPVRAADIAMANGISLKGCVVGSVGNIRPVKGYDIMIDVAAMLCHAFPQLTFIQAGEGPDMDELKTSCIRMGIDNKFLFLGKQEHIPEVLSLMDIYLQPSRSEGFSNAILEAMASGLPVIATRVGGNPEVIDDEVNGYLLESEDAKAIAERISLLIKNNLLRRNMGEAARKKVKLLHDISFMMQQYEGFYYESIAAKGTR